MNPDEKRSSLRASGVRPPRKRALSESTDADKDLEDLMLPLMDEAVSSGNGALLLEEFYVY